MKRRPELGFTLVELLVVIAIIGVLVATTIPAVQASREMGRRTICQANLAQLSLAMQDYENSYESFPPGVTNPDGPIRCEPVGLHYGWLVPLLPYVDEGNTYRLIDQSVGVYSPANAAVRQLTPRLFVCPSDPDEATGASSYAGCHHDVEAPIAADNQGVLFLNSHVVRREITDGLSHTLLLGEKRSDAGDLGWMSGTRATLRNTGLPPNSVAPSPLAPNLAEQGAEGAALSAIPLTYVGGFGSVHVSGLFVGFADGSAHYLADTIDPLVWQQLGNRSGGKLLNFNVSD